jgi:hypothetical protein
MKIEKGEDAEYISEAAVQLTPFGGPVKFKKRDESLALVAQNATSFSSASSSSSEVEEDCTVPPLRLRLLIPQIPHPSVPPLFHQDPVISSTARL